MVFGIYSPDRLFSRPGVKSLGQGEQLLSQNIIVLHCKGLNFAWRYIGEQDRPVLMVLVEARTIEVSKSLPYYYCIQKR